MSAGLRVDLADPTPPYEQLRRQLAALIGSGALAAGARLPPLRQLARDLGLAVGTVGRTYSELEGAGLVVSRRGAGTRVAAASALTPERVLAEAAEAYAAHAASLGSDRDAAVAALLRAWHRARE